AVRREKGASSAASQSDFLTLAATEPRIYGATTPLVTRRLRSMYEQLRSAAASLRRRRPPLPAV
ncbi:MAG TPA: hypothetical protein VMC79_13485, partial [Rectinemataceae bacterium]|nr:hypothetical protein [Rectinemataceae bacterium]